MGVINYWNNFIAIMIKRYNLFIFFLKKEGLLDIILKFTHDHKVEPRINSENSYRGG